MALCSQPRADLIGLAASKHNQRQWERLNLPTSHLWRRTNKSTRMWKAAKESYHHASIRVMIMTTLLSFISSSQLSAQWSCNLSSKIHMNVRTSNARLDLKPGSLMRTMLLTSCSPAQYLDNIRTSAVCGAGLHYANPAKIWMSVLWEAVAWRLK